MTEEDERKKVAERVISLLRKRISNIMEPYGIHANNPGMVRRAVMRYLDAGAIRDAQTALKEQDKIPEKVPSSLDIC